MKTPDFAFPKTVAEDSRKNLDKALQENKPEKALRALMDLSIAETRISKENAIANLALIDSVSYKLPSPFNAIGFLIEAQIYNEIYTEEKWIYDDRTVAPGMEDLNPEFWDKNLFRQKIIDLTSLALDQRETASKQSLSEISLLVENFEGIKEFTIYDFIVYKTIDLRSEFTENIDVIPFYKDDTAGHQDFATIDASELLQQLIDLHSAPSLPLVTAIENMTNRLTGVERANYLWEKILELKEDVWVCPLMATFYTNFRHQLSPQLRATTSSSTTPSIPVNLQEFYRLAIDMMKKFRGKGNVNYLDYIICNISEPSVKVNNANKVITGKDFEVEVISTNLNKFYVLLLSGSKLDIRSYKPSELASIAKIEKSVEINLNGEIPFMQDTVLNFKVKEPGLYSFIVSSSPALKDIINTGSDVHLTTFTASDIDLINFNNGCFVVDAANSSPVEGASVVFSTHYYNGRWNQTPSSQQEQTDRQGYAETEFDNADVTAKYKGSKALTHVNKSYVHPVHNEITIRLFTDRSTYRPGDIVHFMGIIFRETDTSASLLSNHSVSLTFNDANDNEIESKEYKSDDSGRFFGEFKVPSGGLLGFYSIRSINTYYPINIAEYKTPTRLLTLERSAGDSEFIEFKGRVATYSGMPLGNLKVNFNVSYSPYFWFWDSRHEEYASNVTSDGNGEFTIRLPLGNLAPDKYRGIFTIEASATDNAGETATSPSRIFWLKNNYSISASIPGIYKISKPEIEFNVMVNDAAGLPVVKTVEYKITDNAGNTVKKGMFESPKLMIDTTGLPSGEYEFTFNIKGEDCPSQTYKTIFYRDTDTVPPVQTELWVPENDIVVPTDANKATITYGSSYEGQHILCVIGDSKGNTDYQWLKSDGKLQTIQIDAPADTTRKFIKLITYKDHKPCSKDITVIPYVQTEKMTIQTETFRNSLSAGEEETWKFKLLYNDKPIEGYAYAVLYDKAMDAIDPLYWNSWLFNPRYYYPINCGTEGIYSSSRSFFYNRFNYSNFEMPEFKFDTYGYSFTYVFWQNRRYRLSRSRSSNAAYKMSNIFVTEEEGSADIVMCDMEAPMASFAKAEAADEEVSITGSGDMDLKKSIPTDAEEEEMIEDVEYRPIEMPVAFFQPDLISNQEGEVTVKFMVPNFNTTWKFILGAYTDRLTSAQINLETVASKKVMVKMLPPRFLRTGDNATITATLFNNTPETQMISGDFEIFNPISGELIKRISLPASEIAPSGNRIISIDYDCPDKINILGLRVYARGEGASDGEQTIIPVLPSSQPIIESDPFYLQPGQTEFSMPLPSRHKNASMTFTYCDNPTWEMITALPSLINPASDALTAQVYALYANSVGYGLMKNNPNLAKGLKMMLDGEAGDSILISNLEKDPELKTVALNNTPWVNNAKSETLRMSLLGSLLDDESANKQISELWNKILNLQNPNGGWSWCPKMEPGLWPTEVVLINIALLKGKNYLIELENVDKAMKDGLSFSDRKYIEEYNKINGEDKDWFYRSMQNYLFTRTFFSDIKTEGQFVRLKKKALDYFEANWKNKSIFDKATIALILWREGRKSVAVTVLESLRQFASESPKKGAWFDNLDASWDGASKIFTTARALTAFSEIIPNDPIIDKLRQWILLQRQAQDFQEGLYSVDVIDAVLNTGTEWTGEYPAPEIAIGDNRIPQTEVSALTGECKIDIDFSEIQNGDISIVRFSPTPAWGGIISQFIMPMRDVKADAIEDLSIEKEYWKIVETTEGKSAVKTNRLQIGDKVRVTLIIDCGRDMDYVALTDQRSACLEPAAQLSGYDIIDGLWCYHETRNNSTNLFFGFLPRGRHVVSYECRVMEAGEFASGVATLQCQYAPVLTAHSKGEILKVEN